MNNKKSIRVIALIFIALFSSSCNLPNSSSTIPNGMNNLKTETLLATTKESSTLLAPTETPIRSLTNTGIWELGYYVDEFNIPTDEKYIRNILPFRGTFSNSATTNSELLVRVLFDKDGFSIMLYEYGDYLVKNSYSSEDQRYYVTLLTPNGNKIPFDGIMKAGSDRITFSTLVDKSIKSFLDVGGTIRFYIVNSDYETESYLFSIENSDNFDDLYKMLF